MEVVELPIETIVDLPVEPTLELVPSLTVMMASLFLRSPDVYDILQIFLQETGSQEISALVCGSVFRRAELTLSRCIYLTRAPINDHLFVTKASSTSTT